MAKVSLRQRAVEDLSDIWEYTSFRWSETQADKYYRSLKFSCKEIGENPEIGKAYPEISRDILGFQSGKHIIFYYSISDEEVEIIRILHERMNLGNRLAEEDQ